MSSEIVLLSLRIHSSSTGSTLWFDSLSELLIMRCIHRPVHYTNRVSLPLNFNRRKAWKANRRERDQRVKDGLLIIWHIRRAFTRGRQPIMQVPYPSRTQYMSLVPKESMVSDSVGTRPWYLAAPRKDHAISQPVLKHGFRRAVCV